MTADAPVNPYVHCYYTGNYPNLRERIGLNSETVTRSTKVGLEATFSSTGAGMRTLGAEVWLSQFDDFSSKQVFNRNLVTSADSEQVETTIFETLDLLPDTLYYVRFYSTEDGVLSDFILTTFWTERGGNVPVIVSPVDGDVVAATASQGIMFEITRSDPDDEAVNPDPSGHYPPFSQDYVGFEVYYRTAAQFPARGAGPWLYWFGNVALSYPTSADPSRFAESPTRLLEDTYDIMVVTYSRLHRAAIRGGQSNLSLAGRSQLGAAYSAIQRLYVGVPGPRPLALFPAGDQVVEATSGGSFEIDFTMAHASDPNYTPCGDTLFRIRKAGNNAWTVVTLSGNPDTANSIFDLGLSLNPYTRYEWQVSDYFEQISPPGACTQSSWSPSVFFWTVAKPVSGPVLPVSESSAPLPTLGCGTNRVFLYDRGGVRRLGEITGISSLKWERVRDDISTCNLTVTGWDDDCGALLAGVRSWVHELVVFREGPNGTERVWEGPVTLPTWNADTVTIEAKDVMIYPYRRVLRTAVNDAYPNTTAVTTRAKEILQNALVYDDPNVLPYLNPQESSGDAQSSRVVRAFDDTSWGVVDDMAAKSGLDYTTVGRSIILWDTHNPLGYLPEMTDGDFSEAVHVSEYGMRLATNYAVTNNNGVYGEAIRGYEGDEPLYYGHIEMLNSAYGQAEGAALEETLTPEAQAALEAKLTSQAERNIADRWPTPLVVRVPDNSYLNPELNIGINQLVPGVFIPLRSSLALRNVTQIQKLDRVTVTQDDKGEKIAVIMSPRSVPDSETGETNEGDPEAIGGDTTTGEVAPDETTPEPTAGQLSTFTDSRITEASGSCRSRNFSGPTAPRLWFTNDEGGDPQLFLVDVNSGSTVATQGISGVGTIVDPEALAWVANEIWLADTGDNDLNRTDCAIIVVPEAPAYGDNGAIAGTRYPVSYPGGAKHNVECMMVHPGTGDVYLASKHATAGSLFSHSGSLSGGGNAFALVSSSLPANIADGCFTETGNFALFKVVGDLIYVFETATWTQVSQIGLAHTAKGESVTMDADNKSFIFSSEGVHAPIFREILPVNFRG